MDITYDYYRIFYYVTTYKSFSKAAKVLGSNQPNITHFMNNLENQLGCRLFVRSNRGVTLTQEGELLYQHVRIAYQQLHAAEVELAGKRSMESGSVTISASEIALHLRLLPVLTKFHKSYPNIQLQLLNHSTPRAIRAVKEGQADLAIVTTPLKAQKPLKVMPLMKFREIAVGSPAFCLDILGKERDSQVHLKEIASHPIVSLEKDSTSYKFYSEWFMEQNLIFTPNTEVETMDQILPLISCGLGIGFLPELYVKPAIEAGKLQMISLYEKIPEREICLVENINFPPGIAEEAFKHLLL